MRFQRIRDDLISCRWSPQQIAAKLRGMHPYDLSRRVSHETIYAAIFAHPRGGLKKELVEALPQHKSTRVSPRTTAAKRSWVPEEPRTVDRPEDVAQHLTPGHWEGNLLKSSFNPSCVGTLVKRKTRFGLLSEMDACIA